jgi:hypothetical protein
MQIPRSLCAGVAGLVLMGGCGGGPDAASPASPDLPPAPAFSPAQPQETALETLHDFEAYRQPPTLAEVERALNAEATAVPRADRHLEARFPGGVRYLRLTPAPPDGRPRLDTGPMTALTVPAAADAA